MTHTTLDYHEIPNYPGCYLSRCGERVPTATVVGQYPTCPACAELEAEDEETARRLEVLVQTPSLNRPPALLPIDTLAGYRLRKKDSHG